MYLGFYMFKGKLRNKRSTVFYSGGKDGVGKELLKKNKSMTFLLLMSENLRNLIFVSHIHMFSFPGDQHISLALLKWRLLKMMEKRNN